MNCGLLSTVRGLKLRGLAPSTCRLGTMVSNPEFGARCLGCGICDSAYLHVGLDDDGKDKVEHKEVEDNVGDDDVADEEFVVLKVLR
jgi:ferredoxin